MKKFVPPQAIIKAVMDLMGAKGKTLGDPSPSDKLQKSFLAAAPYPKLTEQIAHYTPDWKNENNDAFISNAKMIAVRCLLRKQGSIEFAMEGGSWKFRMMMVNPEATDRLLAAISYAEDWRAKQEEEYGEPRLIEFPSLFKSVIWMPGREDAFILASEFGTKPGDTFSVDKDLITKLKKEMAEKRKQYKSAPPGFGG